MGKLRRFTTAIIVVVIKVLRRGNAGIGEDMGKFGASYGRRRRLRETRRRWRRSVVERWGGRRGTLRERSGGTGKGGGVSEEDGRGLVGNGEGFAGGKGDKGRAGEAEGTAVVGVGGGEVVAGVNCLLH